MAAYRNLARTRRSHLSVGPGGVPRGASNSSGGGSSSINKQQARASTDSCDGDAPKAPSTNNHPTPTTLPRP